MARDEQTPDKGLEGCLINARTFLLHATDQYGRRIPEARITKAYTTLVNQLGLKPVKRRRTYFFTLEDVEKIKALGITQTERDQEKGWNGYTQAADDLTGYLIRF